MRFFLDANLPRAAARALEAAGHDVDLARDTALAAASDDEIAAHAVAIGATLVTRDLDFADVRRYAPAERPGVIVLRLDEVATAAEIAAALERFARTPEFLAALPGRLVILERDRARFRPPLMPRDS